MSSIKAPTEQDLVIEVDILQSLAVMSTTSLLDVTLVMLSGLDLD